MRLLARLRSRVSSMLPVPLNSSKITWSMRLPVSTRQLAMMVRLPPFSTLRAAPKRRLGISRARASRPPERVRPVWCWPPTLNERQARERVEHDHHVLAELDQPLGPLDHELGEVQVLLD